MKVLIRSTYNAELNVETLFKSMCGFPIEKIWHFIHCYSNPFSKSFADNEKWTMLKYGGNACIVQIMALNGETFHLYED